MRNKLHKFAIDLLAKLLLEQSPTRGKLSQQNYTIAMSKLFQNPAFIQYCDEREDYLSYQTMNLLARDELLDAKGITGQLLELRSLRKRAQVCYDKLRKEK